MLWSECWFVTVDVMFGLQIKDFIRGDLLAHLYSSGEQVGMLFLLFAFTFLLGKWWKVIGDGSKEMKEGDVCDKNPVSFDLKLQPPSPPLADVSLAFIIFPSYPWFSSHCLIVVLFGLMVTKSSPVQAVYYRTTSGKTTHKTQPSTRQHSASHHTPSM